MATAGKSACCSRDAVGCCCHRHQRRRDDHEGGVIASPLIFGLFLVSCVPIPAMKTTAWVQMRFTWI